MVTSGSAGQAMCDHKRRHAQLFITNISMLKDWNLKLTVRQVGLLRGSYKAHT